MVEFCKKCNNLYNYRLNPKTSKLEYICYICNTIDENVNEIIEVSNINGDTLDYYIDENIKYDNTFPRTFKIKCTECNKNTEIIITQKNPKSYETIYICTECNTIFN
jgi:DNA-directed RNA polymerase subunit M/transcription elongation factor TFIIS